MYTKNALGNLKNRYIAVLKKCSLINVFGSLALATLLATPSFSFANALITTNEPVLNNSGTLTGVEETLSTNDYFVGMFGYNDTSNQINYLLTNYADGIISFTTNEEAYGMLARSEDADGNFTLLNKGTIDITSTDEAFGMAAYLENGSGNHNLTNDASITVTADKEAHGMYAYADVNGSHTLTNNKTITVTSLAANNNAYGMRAEAEDYGSHTLINIGFITVKADDSANGMYAYGEGNHKLTNNGTITATSIGDDAIGMYAEGDGSHTLINTGTITATSTSSYYIAYGMYAEGSGNHILTNTGTITASSAGEYAYGMYADGTGNHTLTNNGTITATSTDEVAIGMYADGKGNHAITNNKTITVTSVDDSAYAMYADGDGDHTLTNTGTITATSTSAYGSAYAMRAEGKGSHSLINSGTVTVKAGDEAYAMYAQGKGNHTLTNSGTITVKADDNAYGMRADDEGNHKLTNTETIIATSIKDNAYGMRAKGEGNHTLINSGAITIKAYDEAYGICADGDGNHNLTNNGTITVTSVDDRAYAMYADGKGNHNLTNNGTITATSTDSSAYGIYVSGTNTANGVHLINNTGIINASSANKNAFEVYAYAPYSIGTYATTLREWTIDDAVFGVYDNVVNFADSTLILRPGTIAQGFEYGKEYEVTDMIVDTDTVSSPATITGKIQNAVAEVPFLIANLNNSEPTQPKVSLTANVNKDTVTPTQLTKLSVGNVHNKVTRMANRKINKMIERRMARNLKQVSERAYEQGVILAGHHIPYAPTYQENTWAIYLDAYAGYTGNSEDNFGTHTKGMTLGGERAIGDKLNVGFAMDFSDSSTDAQQGLTADSTDITLAVNADYFINPNWYVSGNMALSFGENDMDYMMSPILYAEDDFNSQAFYMSVNTGYIYEINENNIIVPEFGLSYLYSQNDDIDIDFAGSDVYDMRIKNDSFSALYANLMLTWQGQYDIALGTLRPSAGLGIRQNLTGSDFDSSVQALGSSFDTVVTEDDTTFLTNLGLEWQKGNFSMGISYSGGYGSEQQSHSGNVKFRYEF